MFSPQIRQFLRLQRIATTLAGLSFGLLVSVLANYLSEPWLALLPWVAGVAVVFGLLSLWLLVRRPPPNIEVAIRAPQTIRSPAEAQRYARRGFVGLVSLYTPKAGTAAARLSSAERLQAAKDLDFERLQIEQSNLQPMLQAILSHASRLEHCWLLTTSGKTAAGSEPYAHLLAEYLRRRQGLKCRFYYGDAYTISLDEDALVLSKTYDQVRRVFQQADRLGLARSEVVVDITAGFRSMTLGLVLASLSRDRDVEFIGTRYDELGRPGEELYPIIFSFEPILEAKR